MPDSEQFNGADSPNQSRNVKQKFDGIKTCAVIVDAIRASVRLSAHQVSKQLWDSRLSLDFILEPAVGFEPTTC